MRSFIAGSLGCALLTLSLGASAQQWQGGFNTNTGAYGTPFPRSTKVENIGNQGQWVFGAERITSVGYERLKTKAEGGATVAHVDADVNLNLFAVAPTQLSSVPRLALDYLVTDGITVGGSLGLLIGSRTSTVGDTDFDSSRLGFLVSPRIGYAYAFDETFGIWPRIAVNYAYLKTSTDRSGAFPSSEQSDSMLGGTVDVMAVLSPFKHVAFLGGPYVEYFSGTRSIEGQGLSNAAESDAKLLSIGLSFAVSAYY